MCALQASLAQLAARRPAQPDAAPCDTGGGDGDALAAKYRRVKAAARAATARVAQLQGAWLRQRKSLASHIAFGASTDTLLFW